MSKFSNLKENMHRFKTKNLTEQAVHPDAKVSPTIEKFLNKNISADMVFMKREKNHALKDISIGKTEMPTQFNQFWNSSLEQYRKDKDPKAFKDLMTTLQNPQVIVKPWHGGQASPYKYEVVNTKYLRLVKV